MSLSDYNRLKTSIDAARSRRDKNLGAAEQIRSQLMDDYECKTLEEAEKLLEKCRQKEENETGMFEKMLEEYRKKWESKQ